MEDQSRYLMILRDSLSKKERILNNLLEITKQQSEYLDSSEFETEVFEQLIEVKATMIEELNTADDGFESTYERIGAYLKEHQQEHAGEIREMQNRVREITSLSVSIQALEERNKQKFEKVIGSKRREIHSYKKGSEVMNTYYQSMASVASMNQNSILDKKK